jgi:predicted CoA-substrate-specific enzyme activase
MLAAGIDIGALWTKVVVLDGGRVAGSAMLPTWESGERVAEDALARSLTDLRARPSDVTALVATGAGRDDAGLDCARSTEIVCAARGILHLLPTTRGVIDMGAESTRAVKIDEQGHVVEYALNDKCASGTGIFLDAIGKVMGVEVDRMGPLSLTSRAEVEITSMCVVFAESEVVSQVARLTPKEDILRGIHRSIATRVHSTANRIGLTRAAAIGGLARNVGIVSCLEELMREPVSVPEDPHLVTALGAALAAADSAGGA